MFTREAVRRARPAEPLLTIEHGRIGQRAWPLALVAMVVIAGLAGGIIGGVVTAFFQRNGDARLAAATQSLGADASVGEDAELSDEQRTPAKAEPSSSGAIENTEAASASDGDGAVAGGGDVANSAGEGAPASEASTKNGATDETSAEDEKAGDGSREDAQRVLRGALNEWISATNSRDLKRQMDFYNPSVNAFYRTRNVTRSAVRAEKARVFGHAEVIDVRAADPQIKISPDGKTATMRFRKRYAIEGGGQNRRGEVLQELRWRRTTDGWRIISERDLRVID